MLEWLLGDKTGLAQIGQHFGQMLEDGRHVFDAACNALLGGTDPDVVRDDLYATDRRINKIEQRIRRELVVHMSVGNRMDFPTCLKIMSLVKDAERIGDYGKNIFDLVEACRDFSADPVVGELVPVKDKVSRLLAKVRSLHESQNEEQARAFVEESRQILEICEGRVRQLAANGHGIGHPVAAALMYRYLKRVTAHAMNIVSAILMPVDKLDYYDESDETRDPGDEP